jgi:acyl-CoA thioesterase
MTDFVEATTIEAMGDGRFATRLREDWALWGPAGGYLCALALRAGAACTAFTRPVSLAVQYLAVGRFEDAELRVTSLRAGRRSEALRIDLHQRDRLLLTAQLWAAAEAQPGLEHDHAPTFPVPEPERLRTWEALHPDAGRHPFMAHIEQRPLQGPEHVPPGEPEIRSVFRFRPRRRAEDAFTDAARVTLLLDTFSWLAVYPAHADGSAADWIAPNLDFHFRFHRPTTPHEHLVLRARADLAEAGLIGSGGTIHALDGRLLASGATQLFCTPRPDRFR